jgi:hypothetical protein
LKRRYCRLPGLPPATAPQWIDPTGAAALNVWDSTADDEYSQIKRRSDGSETSSTEIIAHDGALVNALQHTVERAAVEDEESLRRDRLELLFRGQQRRWFVSPLAEYHAAVRGFIDARAAGLAKQDRVGEEHYAVDDTVRAEQRVIAIIAAQAVSVPDVV